MMILGGNYEHTLNRLKSSPTSLISMLMIPLMQTDTSNSQEISAFAVLDKDALNPLLVYNTIYVIVNLIKIERKLDMNFNKKMKKD